MVLRRSWTNEATPAYHPQTRRRTFLSLLVLFTLSSTIVAAEEGCSRSTITSTITKTISSSSTVQTGASSSSTTTRANIGSGSMTDHHAPAPTGGGVGLAGQGGGGGGGGEAATCSASTSVSSRSTLTSTITTTLTRTKTATETATVTGGAHQQGSSSSSERSASASAQSAADAPSTNPIPTPSEGPAADTSGTAMPHETNQPSQSSGSGSQGQLSSTETCTTETKPVITSTSKITSTRTVTKTNSGNTQPQPPPTGSSGIAAGGGSEATGVEDALQTIYWEPGQSGAPSFGTGYEESIKSTTTSPSTFHAPPPSSSAAAGRGVKPPASNAIQRHTSKACLSCGQATSAAAPQVQSNARPKSSIHAIPEHASSAHQDTTQVAQTQPTTTTAPTVNTSTSTSSSAAAPSSSSANSAPDSSGSSALLQKYTSFTDIQLNVFQWDPSTCTTGTWAGSCSGYFDPASCGGLPPVSLSQAVIGSNGSPEHKAFCGKTITIQANGKTTQAIIAGLAGDPIIDSCMPLPNAIGFDWTQGTFPGHQPVQWKVDYRLIDTRQRTRYVTYMGNEDSASLLSKETA